jgi:hypothetical protein
VGRGANAGVCEDGSRDGLAAQARLAALGREQREAGDIRAGFGDCERQVGGAVEDPAQLDVSAVEVRASERRERLLPCVRVFPR